MAFGKTMMRNLIPFSVKTQEHDPDLKSSMWSISNDIFAHRITG